MSPAQRRAPLLAAGIAALLSGIGVGLVRLGWSLPLPDLEHLGVHGPLMVCGFLGTVIGLERAVALGHAWAFGAPLATALGVAALVVVPDSPVGPLSMTVASALLVAIYAVALRRQASLFTSTMALGAVAWLTGNLLWLAGWPIFRFVFWWIGFPVLTIAGERLELTRFLRPTRLGRVSFVLVLALLIGATGLTGAAPEAGRRLAGLGLLLLSLWLARYDVVRHTVRQGGLTRFVAVCLLSGYAWLAVAGGLALFHSGELAGPIYDATLHAVFLGLVFSMIFGHAPIIFPAILGGVVLFRPRFYLHLVLLHASLALRLAGDLESVWGDGSWGRLRPWGGLLNAAAILLFLLSTVLSLRFGAPGDRLAPTEPFRGG